MTEVSYKNELSDQDRSAEYIIPPGLYEAFDSFLAHCKVAHNQPIMIVGDTGVGKSMFLQIYEKLYKERCKADKIKSKVIWTNCAHFGGHHSDINLARSELFGYVGGAFAGADKDKDGLVKQADGGALILDEIDELPEQVQAMLLTFIETGKYRKVGSKDTQNAKVQVIGTIINEEDLCNGFRYRFFPFYIPSLHERRQDVLYYIFAKFPELIKILNSSEVMTLLAYHWPGNVREVDRVAMLMLRQKEVIGKSYLNTKKKTTFSDLQLHFPDSRYTFLNGLHPTLFLDWISSWGGEKFLVSYLKKHGLNLSNPLRDYPFDHLDRSSFINFIFAPDIADEVKNLFAHLEVKAVPAVKEFDRAYSGFSAFCGLFGQRTTKNKNILTDLKNGEIYSYTPGLQGIVLTRFWKSKYLKEKSKSGNVIPKEVYEFWSRLEEQINSENLDDSLYGLEKLNNSEKPQNSDYAQITIDINGMTEDQLLKIYYENLLSISGGIVKEAAKMAGVKENTFRGRLDKVGVSFRRLDKVG